HGVRAGRPRVNLVVDQVVQLEDVDVANRDRIGERLPGTPVEETGLPVRADQPIAVAVRQRAAEKTSDLLFTGAVEDRRRHLGVGLRLIGTDRTQRALPLRVIALDLPTALRDPTEVG